MNITAKGLSYIPNVEILGLNYDRNITDEGLKYIPSIKVLYLHKNMNITDKGLTLQAHSVSDR